MSSVASPATRQLPFRAAPAVQAEDAVKRTALRVYTLAFFLDSLAAYNIGVVPLPWLSQLLVIGFGIFFALGNRSVRVPGSMALGALALLGLTLTLGNAVSGQFAQMMPPYATTPYVVYISLRLISLGSFTAQVYLVYWLLCRGCLGEVVRRTTAVGVVCAVFAVYIYVAQLSGLPEPPRNRMGTSGEAQVTNFSYDFHRAMGTFQEPGDMASWLVVPLFVSLLGRGPYKNIWSIMIASAILLSGSLAAIVGAVFGLIIALFIVRPLRLLGPAQLLRIVAAMGVSAGVFTFLAVANEGGSTDLFSVLMKRIEPMLESGMEGSNRNYIYEYVADTPFPILGPGYGHSNLLMTKYFGKDLIVSFISLYFCTIYSLGLAGFVVLLVFMTSPVLRVCTRLGVLRQCPVLPVAVLAAYATWLIMFGVRADDFPAGFGTTYAILAFLGRYPQAALAAMQI